MNINEENKKVYNHYKDKFLSEIKSTSESENIDNSTAVALTELVRYSIELKRYKFYAGGGYEKDTKNPINMYDVVVYFTLTSDPFFAVCIDEDGDLCDLYRCNEDGKVEHVIY